MRSAIKIFLIILAVISMASLVRAELDLTAEEKAFLAAHAPIRIGIMSNWPPLNYVDESGKPAGVGVEYVNALNKNLWGILIVEPAPFNENYEKVKNKQLDALMDITPKPERLPFFEFTKPYLVIPHVIVGRKGDPYFSSENDLKGKTVALEKGYYNIKYFRQNHPAVKIREYASTSDALDAVARAEADAYAGNRAVAIYLIEKEVLSNLDLEGRLSIPPIELTIGVRKDWPILAVILNKALMAIPESEHAAINAHFITALYEPWYISKQFWTVVLISIGVVVLIGLLSLVWNRSLRRLVELRTKALHESEEKYRKLVENAGQLILVLRDARIKYVNGRSVDLFGRRPEEVLDQPFIDFVYPDDQKLVAANYAKRLRGENVPVYTFRVMPAPGATKWVEVSGVRIEWQGEPATLIFLTDITERKRAEKEIEFKGMLLDTAADSIIVHDLSGRIVYANKAAEELRGYAGGELIGKDLHKLSTPEYAQLLNGRVSEINQKGELKFESAHYRHDGSSFPIELHARLIEHDGKKMVLRIGRDITERKRADEKEIELMKAREVDHLKSLFIASMSHELRTPLNSIIGFTGILLMGMAGELNEEQKKQLTMVKSSAGHLLALINDVIDVSKIEAEKIQLTIGEFDLAHVIKEVKDSFTAAAGEKGLNLNIDIHDSRSLKSDERRTKQIIMNLVSNAIKFTEKGEIGIKVTGKGNNIAISVKDAGVGIKKEDMPKLFKQFSRIMVEGQPLQEGTGLGLYLSQKLARVLGGEIKAESEFGHGSEFTLTLPLEYKGG